jgi:hypothetical protein
MITCSNIIPITLHAINIKENQQLKTIWVNISCFIIASVNLIMWIFVVKRPVMNLESFINIRKLMIISIFCTLLQILPLFKNYETIKESLNIQIEILTKLYSNGSYDSISNNSNDSIKNLFGWMLCVFLLLL